MFWLMRKAVRVALVVAIVAAAWVVIGHGLASGAPTEALTANTTVNPLANPPTVTPGEAEQDNQFDQDVNIERQARGLSTLPTSSYLQALAQAYVDYEDSLTGPPWASGGLATLQFDDIGPTFSSNWIAANPCTIAKYGWCPASVNEGVQNGQPYIFTNLTSVEVGGPFPNGFTTSVGMTSLMESRAHRNGILAPGNQTVGTGAACTPEGWMVDTLFGSTATTTPPEPNTPLDPLPPLPVGIDPCPGYVAPTIPGPVVGMAALPDGLGYWLADAQGNVAAYGEAVLYGSMSGVPLNAPISHIVSTPDGLGYWLVAGDGGVFSFGDAQFYGSMGGKPLNAPVMDIIPTSNGAGYWLVATDGGIFSFGNAQFYGSMGGTHLNAPVNGGSYAQGGYRMVANDGGIFDFGGAQFYGSMGGKPLNRPIVGMADTPNGAGYWEVASDGGLFTFGDAPFYGSLGGDPPSTPVVGMAVDDATGGYWIVDQAGQVFGFNAPLHNIGELS